MPTFQRRNCHKQTGVNDCGVFAIAYAVNILNGIEPDGVVFDQSKMREHLIQCFEKQDLQPFPIYRRVETTKPTIQKDNSSTSWIKPRRSARLSQKNSSVQNLHVQNRFSPLEDSEKKSHDSTCEQE